MNRSVPALQCEVYVRLPVSMSGTAPAWREQARALAMAAWSECDPGAKCSAVDSLLALCDQAAPINAVAESAALQTGAIDLENLRAGAPPLPRLVHPSALAKRATAHAAGRAAMLHAIAHIEFNAVNLALDAIWRYPQMPEDFLIDWAGVARDEALHFRLLVDELASSGHHYGDFDAHDGLWEMAERTAPDLLARMALVPRVLEARGLDATPLIQKRFRAAGDQRAVAILQQILDDEIDHVRIGDRWFRRLCQQAQQEPEAMYRELIQRFRAPMPRPPINRGARRAAGFSEAELRWLDTRD